MNTISRSGRVAVLTISLFLTSMLVVATADAQIGAAVGLNFDSITDIDTGDREATFDNASGYHIGVFYDLAVGPVAIRPGLFYRRVSDVRVDLDDAGAALAESFDLSMVEIPIDVRYRMPLPIVTPYALAGPVIGFASTSHDDFEDAVEDFTIAANIGIGVELSLPGFTPVLYPELRYSFGISRFMKENLEIAGIEFEAADTQRLNTFMLRLGVRF